MSNKKAQRAKASQNYRTPRDKELCRNCKHYERGQSGFPATDIQPMVPWRPNRCLFGEFIVEPNATCDQFVRRKGGTAPAPSMNPGLLDGIPMPHQGDTPKLPRLAGEWANF